MAYRPRGLNGAELLAHIWSRCVRTPNGCLEWQGSLDDNRYAKMSYQGKTEKVSRVVLSLLGKLGDGEEALHSCDNPPCLDPEHLHSGTHSLNMIERSARGRDNLPRGAAHHMRRNRSA